MQGTSLVLTFRICSKELVSCVALDIIQITMVDNFVLHVLQSGLTPLHLSAQEDRVSAAEVLAKHDANLDQQTKVQTDTHMQVHTNTTSQKLDLRRLN